MKTSATSVLPARGCAREQLRRFGLAVVRQSRLRAEIRPMAARPPIVDKSQMRGQDNEAMVLAYRCASRREEKSGVDGIERIRAMNVDGNYAFGQGERVIDVTQP